MNNDVLSQLKDKVLVAAVTNDDAKIWLLHGDGAEPVTTIVRHDSSRRHHRAALESRARDTHVEDAPFFVELSQVLAVGTHVVLVGHGHGKANTATRFHEHVATHDPGLNTRIEIVRHVDIPALTNGQILADARKAWDHR